MNTTITRGRIERTDTALFYEMTGSGPPLVFAHGLGGNHLSWWQQIAAFRDRFTCVAFAHRGFNPSLPVAGGPDPHDFAGDLAALADALGLGRFAYVGQSMGGWTGIEFALAHPGRLSKLVLSATSGMIDPRSSPHSDLSRLDRWQSASAAAMADCRAKGIHIACGARMAAEQPAMHLLYQQVDGLSFGLDKEKMLARLWETRTRPASDLARIDCPILWVTGDEDIVFASPAVPALAGHCADASHVELPQTGHSGYFERPAAFNAALSAFLARG
jgi:3-oxoadipate enol-lactonase